MSNCIETNSSCSPRRRQAAAGRKRLAVALLILRVAPALQAQSPADSLPANPRAVFTEQDIDRAIAGHEALLQKYPAQDFTPYVMFQLSELYVRRSTVAYQSAMAQYDAELKRYDAGERPVEPVMPRHDFHEAIELADQLLVRFPTADFLDRVLYRLAIIHRDEGNLEVSREYLERLVAEYPRSSYQLEAYFRIGETYFAKRLYDKAIPAYAKLLNQWDNSLFSMSLYKLGWSYYNISDYGHAISTFIYLIDDLNKVSSLEDAEALGKTRVDLRKEAIEYVAQCFAEFGGVHKAERFFAETLEPLQPAGRERDYMGDVFMKLATLYELRNDYQESLATLEFILRHWPLHLEAPQLQNRVVENQLRLGNAEGVEMARERLVKNYGPGSAWLNHYFAATAPEEAIQARMAALVLAEQTLYTLATETQARAQKNNSSGDYGLAILRCREFLEKFPQSISAAKVQYALAECYYEVAAFADAADAYHKVVTNFPASEFAGEAAYNRVIAHLEEVTRTTSVDSLTYQFTDFLGTGIAQLLRLPNQAYANLLNACDDFCKLPLVADSARPAVSSAAAERGRIPEVMMKYGETLYKLDQFELARQVYARVATDFTASPFTFEATRMAGQSSFLLQNYAETEKWYRKIVSAYPDSAAQINQANKVIATARFKIAEGIKSQGRVVEAAGVFAALADSVSEADIAEQSLVEAAALYEAAGDKPAAIAVYESLFGRFPKSERAEPALFKAAQLAEEQSNWELATKDYISLANAFPVSAHAAAAVFQAGLCYENAGDTLNALAVFRRYAQTYKEEDPSRVLEVLFKIGEIYQQQGQARLALKSYQETLDIYTTFVERSLPADEYMPAQAQFRIAEIRFGDYRQVELTPPVDRNFKKKQKLFNEVIALYRKSAEFQVGEWATASSYKIGEAFEEFARAFSEAPRPQGLSEDTLVRYEDALKEKVRPFKERALETYRATVSLAEENSITNEWVERSHQRAAALAAELGVAAFEAVPASPIGGGAVSTN